MTGILFLGELFVSHCELNFLHIFTTVTTDGIKR